MAAFKAFSASELEVQINETWQETKSGSPFAFFIVQVAEPPNFGVDFGAGVAGGLVVGESLSARAAGIEKTIDEIRAKVKGSFCMKDTPCNN